MYCCSGCTAYNLGTGRGTSVLEMVTAFEKASGKVNMSSWYTREMKFFEWCKNVKFYSNINQSLYISKHTNEWNSVIWRLIFFHWISNLQKIPVKLCPRRPGDATEVYASTERAEKELGWK